MAINLATKYSPVVDEVITQESTTNELINRNISFLGVKTVKVWSVTAADEGNYTRSGTARYGTPAELADTVQELSVKWTERLRLPLTKATTLNSLTRKKQAQDFVSNCVKRQSPALTFAELQKARSEQEQSQ